MITSASLRINILCINFKIRTRLFYSTTLLTHVGIGFCKKKNHLQDRIISPRGNVYAYKLV